MPNYQQPGAGDVQQPTFSGAQYSNRLSQYANGGTDTSTIPAAVDDRPYRDVGKMRINLLDLEQPNEDAPGLEQTGGLFTGFLGGIGGTFGEPGRQAGEFLGGLIEAPLGILGGVMAGVGGVGVNVRAPDAERMVDGVLPPGEEINPAFADMSAIDAGGNVTLGSITMSLLGTFGLLGRVVERAYAGSEMRDFSAAAPDLQRAVDEGTMTREQAADLMVQRGLGFSDDMISNIGFSILLDPLTWATLGVGAIGKGAAATAKIAGAAGKTEAITASAARGLLRAGTEGDGPILRLSRLEQLGLATAGRASSLLPDSAFVKIANQVTRITDPLKFFGGGNIGKRTADHIMAGATEGWIAAMKPAVVNDVVNQFSAVSEEAGNRLTRALATAVTNITHRWLADEFINDALRSAGDEAGATVQFVRGQDGISLTPNQLNQVTLDKAGVDRSVGRQIELLVQRVKPFLANMTDEQMRTETIAKAAAIAGVTADEMAKRMTKVGYDEAALIHAAFYNHTGRSLMDEVIPGLRGGYHVLPGDIPDANRLTLVNERTFTQVRKAELRAALDKAKTSGDTTTVRKIISKLEDFDFINEKNVPVEKNADLISIVENWMKENGGTALTEVRLRDASNVIRADLPAPLREWMENAEQYGYRLALTPTGSAESLFRITRDAEGRLLNARPWVDFVSEGSEFVRPNRLQQVKMQVFREIRAESIVWTNRRTFVRNLSQKHKIAPGTAERMFRTIVYAASERGIAPRGLKSDEMFEAAKRAITEEAKLGGGMVRMTERELVREVLVAFKGDFSQVGITQAFTGKLKVGLPGARANFWGGLAEKVYPMVKFTFSPWFMLQEYVEPYILNAMRGIRTPLKTNSVGFQHALATRNAINQFLNSKDFGSQGALMEMSEYQRMLAGAYTEVHTRMGGTIAQMTEGLWGDIAARKMAAEALLTKKVFGQRLRQTFTEIRGPDYWAQLERHYGETDAGEIAMRWMAENHTLRDANGEKISSIADMLNPINVGAETRIARGTGPGVRFHHLAEFLGYTDDLDGEQLISRLKTHWVARVRNEPLPADGLSREDFFREGIDAGMNEAFLERAFNTATGPEVGEFWDGYRKTYTYRTVTGTKAKMAEVDMARALVQVRAATANMTEAEYIKSHFADIPRRIKGGESSMAGAERLFEHREGMFGPEGLFVRTHGDSFEEAALATGQLGTDSAYVYHGTMPSLGKSIEKSGMHPGSNWTTDLDEALKYAFGNEPPIFRSRATFVKGQETRPGVFMGQNVRPRFIDVSKDGGKTWVRVTTKQPIYMDVPSTPAAFRSEVGYTFLADERGMARRYVPKAPKPKKAKPDQFGEYADDEDFEDWIVSDADSWLDNRLDRVGAPNAIERLDRNLNVRDWDGAPSIEIEGYTPTPRDTQKIAVYVQRDAEGKIAAYSIMPLNGETGKAEAIVSTRVRADVQGRGIGTRLYEAADADGVDARAVTGQNGVTAQGKPFSEAYRNRPISPPYVEPAVRQSVMGELDEPTQAANLFTQMVVNSPEELIKGLDEGTIDPRHRKAIENAIETAKAQMPRDRLVFTRKDGKIERYGMVTAKDLADQNAQWMTTKQGKAAGYWYRDMRQRFVRLFGADHGPVLLAFAVSQASAAPTNGWKNVLHVMEQLFTDGFEARVLDVSREASTKNRIRMMAKHKLLKGKANWDRFRISPRGRERALADAVGQLEEAGVKLTGELNEENIVKALIGAKIESGFGPKLNDFLDSLLENPTRRWAGRQGLHSPVAVDRWTARDVGFLDDVTLDHLADTYGATGKNGIVTVFDGEGASGKAQWTMRKEQIGTTNGKPVFGWRYVDDAGNYTDAKGVSLVDSEGKLLPDTEPVNVADFTGAPEEYGYEHGVRVINESVAEFNNYVNPDGTIGMYGRADWTAADVQAVGWIRMQKVMGGAEENPFDTFAYSTYEANLDVIPMRGTDLEDRALVVQRLNPEQRVQLAGQLISRQTSDVVNDWGITTIGVSDEAHYAERIDSTRPRSQQVEVHVRDESGKYTRGRTVKPDEIGALRVRGARIIADSLSAPKRPLSTTGAKQKAIDRIDNLPEERTLPEDMVTWDATVEDLGRRGEFHMPEYAGTIRQRGDGYLIAYGDDGDAVGQLIYSASPERPGILYVGVGKTRQGIASKLYDEAYRLDGENFIGAIGESTMTPAGKGFAKSWLQKQADAPTSGINTVAKMLHEEISTAWAPRLDEAGEDVWGGMTFDPITGKAVELGDARFASSVGQTIRLTAEEAQDPDIFQAAIARALEDERFGREGYVLGVFNDKDAGNVVDIDINLMVKGDVEDAESVQVYLGREGGAYDYSNGNGVYAPLVHNAGISAPVAVLATPTSAIDWAERTAITTRQRVTVPIRQSASSFRPTKHRPVVDFWMPAAMPKQKAIDNLLAVVNALRDEQEALAPALRRTFEYSIHKDEAGRYAVRIIDDADVGSSFFKRYAEKGKTVKESKGMVDASALEERMGRAAKVAGLDKESLEGFDLTHFHADLYRAEPIRSKGARPRPDSSIRAAIQAAEDAGDYDLMARLQDEAIAARKAVEDVDDVERLDIEGKIAGFGGRGRTVTEGDIRRWRDEYAEHLDSLLDEVAPENVQRSLRGEALLERRTGAALGYTERADDGRRIVGAFKNADPVTGLHELTHVFATDLDESARRIVIDSRRGAIDARRADLDARITALDARIAAAKSRTTRGRLSKEVAALRHDLGSIADEEVWGVEHEEFFVSEFQKWIKTGTAPTAKLEGVFNHFKNWIDSIWTSIKGQRGMEDHTSPQMTALFEEMFSGKPKVASQNYDMDQHVLRMAAKQQLRASQDEAFTTQYFKKGRSWAERSINHPMMGLYPFSYMWGKVLPEMFRFLALRPFGVTAPMVTWNALSEVSDSVRLQEQTDPAFREFMDNNADLFSTLNTLFPALPSEIPTSVPVWMRRIAEQGLENADRAARGEEVKDVELTKGLADQVSYIFGPKMSLDRLTEGLESAGDIIRGGVGMEHPDPVKEAKRQKSLQEQALAAQNAMTASTP